MLNISTNEHQLLGCPPVFTVNKDAMFKNAARGVMPPILRADCDKIPGIPMAVVTLYFCVFRFPTQ